MELKMEDEQVDHNDIIVLCELYSVKVLILESNWVLRVK